MTRYALRNAYAGPNGRTASDDLINAETGDIVCEDIGSNPVNYQIRDALNAGDSRLALELAKTTHRKRLIEAVALIEIHRETDAAIARGKFIGDAINAALFGNRKRA